MDLKSLNSFPAGGHGDIYESLKRAGQYLNRERTEIAGGRSSAGGAPKTSTFRQEFIKVNVYAEKAGKGIGMYVD